MKRTNSVAEASAFSSLKNEVNSNIDRKVQSHGQGDHQKDWHWNARMSHSTNTLYVPICRAIFDYQGTEYHVWIDGMGEDGIRADKLPEDKGRKKLVYLGVIPVGVGIATLLATFQQGSSIFPGLVGVAIFGGYAAIRRWSIIGYSKKIRDSLLTQIHASSNTIKEMGSEERDKVAHAFQRPEKPFFAKTHHDKFVLTALSLLALIWVYSTTHIDGLEKTPKAETLAPKSENIAAPVPIAAPAPTPPVVVQPDTAPAMEVVSSVPAGIGEPTASTSENCVNSEMAKWEKQREEKMNKWCTDLAKKGEECKTSVGQDELVRQEALDKTKIQCR